MANSNRLSAKELADKAVRQGIPLGVNPLRTITYYKAEGLLKPTILQEGSVRRAYYTEEHLEKLRLITALKKQGKTLREIRQDLEQPIYLSEQALEFVERFRQQDGIPDTAFRRGVPVVRGEVAYLLDKAITHLDPKAVVEFLRTAFVLASGESATYPFLQREG